MNNYVLLFYGGEMPVTKAQQAAEMKRWTTWFTKIGKAVKDPGNPFAPKAMSVGPAGAKAVTGGKVGGYTIIQALSIEAAVKIAKICPVVRAGGKVSVYETFNIM
jgi:hypothetical protein